MKKTSITIVGVMASTALLASLLAPQSAEAGPYTPQEIAELNKMSADLKRFSQAAESYKRTVNSIVRRTFEARRAKVQKKYEGKIKKEEVEERTRRIAAITLFEDFLRRYPNDSRWTPDVIFRLAELYFEKSKDTFLLASDQYMADLKKFDRKEITQAPAPPKHDYTQTVTLYRRLLRDFPKYRQIEGAYYLLGFCLSEMDKREQGNQAYLALVCKDQYKPPVTDADVVVKGGGTPIVDGKPQYALDAYKNCVPLKAKSRFNPDAWIRIGEYHFDENQLGKAIAAYQRVLDMGPKKNDYYDEALYKLAWTYYRADMFTPAIKHFDKLVVWADGEAKRTGKASSSMRPESIQYLAVSFAEEDWDGDQVPDGVSGIDRAEKFYQGREKEKHVYEVYRRLADIYFDTTKYDQAVKVYRIILKRFPYRADNPDIQDRIITALERQRSFEKAMGERENFSKLFGKGSEWEKRNKNNPKALKKAREYDEQALIQAAVFHHNAGRELRKKMLVTQKTSLKLSLAQRAKQEYAIAAKAYERYLERFPNTKNSYELRMGYANCLYFSSRYLEAAKAYEAVRDSNLDDRFRQEAALSAIKAYEAFIDGQVAEGKLVKPPLPNAKLKDPQKKEIPEIYRKLQKAFDYYVKRVPKSKDAARMSYKAGEIAYRHIQFDEARKRLTAVYKNYCKSEVAINSAQAILVTYQTEKQRNLDKMEEWAKKLASGKCGGGSAKKHAGGATKLLTGIRFVRAQTNFEKAEKLYKAGKKREAAPYYDKAAAAYLSLVKDKPKSPDADKALYNAAVAYEKSMRFDSATQTYERVYKEYPNSKLAGEAVWLSAENHKKFFQFDKAVKSYLILADLPRFATNSHRNDAIYNAATILEYDQDYNRAAKLFLRYADQPKVKREDAAEAYFRAARIYERQNNFSQMVKLMRDFPTKYGSVKGQKPRAVEALFRVAKGADKRKMWNTAKKYYAQTVQEFSIRRQPPGKAAASFAAESQFRLLEKDLEKFLKRDCKKLTLKRLARCETSMGKDAVRLKKAYSAILGKYQRAKWSLAAMYRFGSIYEHFARVVNEGYRTTPVPRKVKRLGAQAVQIYQDQVAEALDKKVAPLEAEAKKLYDDCRKKARTLGISNQYTEAAERRLNALDPANYKLLKRAKVETAIE
jgi:tetratricopeptide (TPR) repeat protein